LQDFDSLVPDPFVAEEFHCSLMAIWRWDHDPRMAELGWPAKVQIRKRNYRQRSSLERFKANLLRIAVAEREGARGAA